MAAGLESTFIACCAKLAAKAGPAVAAAPPLAATLIPTPLGPMLAAATERGVCELVFAGRRTLPAQLAALSSRLGRAPAPGGNRHLARLTRELAAYFAGRAQRFGVPLDLAGTAFQRRVWRALCAVPHGETRSYEQIARAAGSPGACRAVGRANAANPVAIVVPCHRVVNKAGGVGGYAGGLSRKRSLLALERHRPC